MTGWLSRVRGSLPPEQCKAYINQDGEDQMEFEGYFPHRGRCLVTWLFIVLTVGLLRLVFYWKPAWYLKCTHVTCSINNAKKVLLKDQYMQLFVETVREMTLSDVSGSRGSPDSTKTASTSASEVLDCVLDLADGAGHIRYFISKKVKYLWNPATEHFDKLRGLDTEKSCIFFHEAQPLTQPQQHQQRQIYGENLIDVKVDSIPRLLFTQVLNPFYIFQIFSCALWYSDEYYYYASAIVVMSVASLTAEVLQTRAMQKALKNTVSASEVVSVCRDDEVYESMPSDLLVPGDVIEVPRHGCVMQCDAVLVTGNCIVNESMLTGESVPVTKTPLPIPHELPGQSHLPFNLKEHGRHTLFCGTHVIQTRYYGKQKVKAVVLRTGFSTAKGELVRSIMFPKPVDFRFSQDTYKFIGVLAGIASIGMVYTVVVMLKQNIETGTIVKRMLDLITIVIPPALPAAMTIGTVFAQRRLKREGIFCISPKSITQCGAINVFCFDKTGTLTEDGLDMWGVVPIRNNQFQNEEKCIPNLERAPLMVAMATCHSLTIIEGSQSGDPLDLRMFESTEWELEEPGEDTAKFDVFMPTIVRPKTPDVVRTSENYASAESLPFEVGILRQFTFSSKLQRMSVIARTLNKTHFDLYAKGAPETIAALCRPETVPKDFHDVLLKYTQHGYRVLALAWKPLKKLNYVKVQRAQREQMECNLILLGLLVMENRLKPRTTSIIQQLQEANIRPVMVTGDNMLTALSVARDCHMIDPHDKAILVQVVPPVGDQEPYIEWNYAEDEKSDVEEIKTKHLQNAMTVVRMDVSHRVHFALTGRSWHHLRQYFPDLIHRLAVRGTVFARFSPEQKQQLVETLQELGYYVGMCGDGANDCGALKTAHTGISLSEAEASVASPFTSKTPDISCVPIAIREGRAALVTSFGVFKYMAGYSLTQFLSVCMLYWIGANLTDFTFLYVDLLIITTLGATFSYTAAYPDLVPQPPPVSLISLTPILSIVLHLFIIAAFQIITWFIVIRQPWFEAFVINDEDDYYTHEMTALFSISSFQYVTLAVVFSKGPPYRKTLFSNVLFLVNIILLTVLNIWVIIYPTDGLAEFLQIKLFPSLPFRGVMVALAVANFFLCFLLEVYVLDSDLVQRRCQASLERRSQRKNLKYLTVEEELDAAPEWPPISESSLGLAHLMRLETSPLHSPDGATSVFPDDDDGDDDVLNNSGSKFERDSILGSGRKRNRTLSSNSTVSRFSGSPLDGVLDFSGPTLTTPDKCGKNLKNLALANYCQSQVSQQWDNIAFEGNHVLKTPDSPKTQNFPLLETNDLPPAVGLTDSSHDHGEPGLQGTPLVTCTNVSSTGPCETPL